jgi:LacI family transcriptional regulator
LNLKEIALAAGVSQATVSMVRKGRRGVSDVVRARVESLLTENNYNFIAFRTSGGLAANQSGVELTKCIQLIIFKKHAMLVEGNDGFVSSIICALDFEARAIGYQLLLRVIGPLQQDEMLNSIAQTPADGVLLIATEMTQDEQDMFSVCKKPLVILDSDFICSPYSCVTMNNRELAFNAVSHLLDLGHPRIGYLQSSIATGNFRSRAQGYNEAIAANQQAYDTRLIYYLRPTLNAAYQDMHDQLTGGNTPPSALFADNDIIALGAIKALMERGYHIPQDISVIGVDNIPFGAVSQPPLTTMGIPCSDIGKWAIRLLMQAIDIPDTPKTKVQVGATLIRRNSTAEYAARRASA